MTWTAPFPDGWNAEQNAAGDIGCGGGGVPREGIPPFVRIAARYPRYSRVVDIEAGHAVGWLDDEHFAYLPLGALDELWTYNIRSGEPARLARNAAGNTVRADDGHWIAVTANADGTGHVVYDGVPLFQGFVWDGGAVAGGRAIHTSRGVADAPIVREYVHGVLQRSVSIPNGGNALTLQADGYIGAGYWGDAFLLRPGAMNWEDVTITPWRQEGAPVVALAPSGTPWLWSATRTPSGRSLVVGRPVGERETCVQVSIEASWLRVRVINDAWSIVAVNSIGQLVATSVPLDAPRAPLTIDAPPLPPVDPPTPPDPPKPPTPPEKPPVPNITAKQLADSLFVAFDVYMRALRRYQAQLWIRDRGDDMPSAGAMAYFDSNFFQAIGQEVARRDRLPGGPTPEAAAADWNGLADLGVARAIAAYKRDQQPDPQDPR